MIARMTLLVLAALAAGIPAGVDAQQVQTEAVPRGPFDVDAMPVLLTGTRAAQISSFDRTGGNDDGNRRWAYLDFDRSSRVFTIFQDTGPGALLRIWMTGWQNPAGLDFFVNADDGSSSAEPTFSVGALEIFGGEHPRFPERFVGDEEESSGGFYSYVPIPYSDGLAVRTTSVSRYIQWTYHRYASVQTPAVNARRRARYLDARGEPTTVDVPAHRIAAFDRSQLFSSASDASAWSEGGVVTQLQLALTWPAGATTVDREMLALEITADDGATEIRVPVVAYFGGVPNCEPVDSLVVSSEHADGVCTVTSRLPIPFISDCTISLDNRSSVPVDVAASVEVSPVSGMAQLIADGVVGYLHAHYNNSVTRPDEDMRLAAIVGHGQLAGIVLTTAGFDTDDRKILEGDERIFVDGQWTPSLHGTGTEDFFNGGWYYKFGPFSQPWHGNPSHTVDHDADRTSQFRFLISDPIPFSRDLTMTMEHGPRNDEPGAYSATAFWYGSPVRTAEVATITDVRAEPAVNDGRLTAVLLGTESSDVDTYPGTTVSADHVYTVAIDAPADTTMLVLRRVVDVSLGNQRVSVNVNGTDLHDWYTPGFTQDPAIVQAEYLIPGSVLDHGNARVTLTAGSDWNTYGFSALAVRE